MSDEFRRLLEAPNLEASDDARRDLQSGLVDLRLVSVLAKLTETHRILVTTIRTGPPLGPRSPAGRENDHFFWRAADIAEIDGESIETSPTAGGAVAVGRALMALHGGERPARVMGPVEWHAALGPGDRTGFRNDRFANSVHHDHLHIGFRAARGETVSE